MVTIVPTGVPKWDMTTRLACAGVNRWWAGSRRSLITGTALLGGTGSPSAVGGGLAIDGD